MKKETVLIIAIVAILSGCVDNKILVSHTEVKNVTTAEDNLSVDNLTRENKTGGEIKTLKASSGAEYRTGDTLDTVAGAEWCSPGSKTTVELLSGRREFTITGITTYRGKEVCKAEWVYEKGRTTRYFSKDGTFEAMNSSASGYGDVYSEARTKVNRG